MDQSRRLCGRNVSLLIVRGDLDPQQSMQVPGEDLTPYRTASKQIWALLDRFGKVQRGGLDEAFLDATDEVQMSNCHLVTAHVTVS